MDTLTAEQRRQLWQALIASFPSVGALEQMVRLELNERLSVVAVGSNLGEIIFKLLEWAEAQGRLVDLIKGACRHNPGNPQLRAFAASLESGDPPSAPPAPGNPFLRDSPRLSGRTDELQRIVERLLVGNHCSVVGAMGSGKTLLLRAVREQLLTQAGWQPRDCVTISMGRITSLSDLQTAIVHELDGQGAETVATLLRRAPPRLLVLDDIGVLKVLAEGYPIRVWLRGHADGAMTFLVTSNNHLRFWFGDDPHHISPFDTIFGPPVELDPLLPAVCRRIVAERLQHTPFMVDHFADLLSVPTQPRALLRLCAQRYDELLRRR